MTKVNSGNVDAKGRYQYYYNPNMTDEQRATATKKLEDIKQNGRVTITNKGYGLSQSFMENFMKEQIEAGNIVDKNDDGEEDIFTQKNKRDLGSAFETTHKSKHYSTDFTHMKKGTSFEYSYDEMKNYVDKAGYKFKEPAKPKESVAPDVVSELAVKDKKVETSQPPVVSAPVETPKVDKVDTVILDSTTYTDENGRVIADDTKALINGQPYHSKTGFGTFGTLSPEHVDWKQYSMKELDGLDAAPTNKKVATEPDKASALPIKDKGAPAVSKMETPVVDVAPVASAVPEEKSVSDSSTVTAAETPVVSATPEEKTAPDSSSVTAAETPVVLATPEEKTAPEPSTVTAAETPVVSATPEEKNAPEPSTTTADVAHKASTELQTPQEKFEASLSSDRELANADTYQRVSILDRRKNDIESQIAGLKKPTVVMQKGFLGLGKAKPKIVKTAEENTATNKDAIAKLEQDLGNTEKLKVYSELAKHINQKYASTKYVDSDGKTVAEYQDYTVVKYRNANGEEVNAARVETFNRETNKNEYSYYTFDVQKVREFKTQPERLQAVPDMNNPLTGGQEM